jgi:hypothetical protein
MPLSIPADLTIVTLSSRGTKQAQRWKPDYAKSVLANASKLLEDRADIRFNFNSCECVSEEMPRGTASDTVDDGGYHFLVAAHRAGTGVRALLVDTVARPELGGESRAQTRVCLIAYKSDIDSLGRMLAHEFGHLLELPHINNGPAKPGQEQMAAAWSRNLMYSGALNPAAELNADQVSKARASALARRFGGG